MNYQRFTLSNTYHTVVRFVFMPIGADKVKDAWKETKKDVQQGTEKVKKEIKKDYNKAKDEVKKQLD